MSKVTHMKVWRGLDGPYAYCGSRSKKFSADGERATCKRCWNRHERIMAIAKAERAAKAKP